MISKTATLTLIRQEKTVFPCHFQVCEWSKQQILGQQTTRVFTIQIFNKNDT